MLFLDSSNPPRSFARADILAVPPKVLRMTRKNPGPDETVHELSEAWAAREK
jgi:hypothetical protein